ncbi:hypothetical protein [Alkalibacillus almallahensis]|uniref:hypothetical protein n=1 Tax=Alkalibacillus almallahensis TaxID=1379154 RepID=UPI00141E6457|nr:hypothetical protein [Alkalibacillus almallahensis]NIK12833.1 tetratricopeptide (TPR) repeat protein [Alkalibacillus almallahensis]
MGLFKFIKNLIQESNKTQENKDSHLDDSLRKTRKFSEYNKRPDWHEKYLEHERIAQENMYVNERIAKDHLAKAYELCKNTIIRKHFLLNMMIDYYYGLRYSDDDALDDCIELCKESIRLAPDVLEEMKYEHYEILEHTNEFVPPSIPSFKRLSIIFENQERYQEAIEICDIALSLQLKDGTKGGFEGRRKRLEKKLNT